MKKIILGLIVLYFSVFIANAQTTEQNYERNFHISFISPMGTNGMSSHLTTNKVSINILGGYSYANTIFEFGSLYNVNSHLTKGFQFSGIINYTGNSNNAAQFAGVSNIAKDGSTPFQFASVSNLVKEVKGLQFAGVSNIAKEVRGVQFSGISNVAKEVKGLQFAGIINITEKLNGIQFGLINFAKNSEEGTPIGLINIVKEGGKQEFEIGFSEVLNTSASFKLGVDHFYTIFSAGVNYFGENINYATGLGFGTHIDWKNSWSNQIEVLGFMLTEEGKFIEDLNMLTQLKYTVSKEISKHFKVYAGPVLNMTISQYTNPVTGELGNSLSPWPMWENTSSKTHLNAWLGITAGIRF